jgi:hypothetical protein
MKVFVKILFLAFALNAVNSFGQTTNYQVYCLYVLNIAKYAAWPANNSEFHITVVGKSKIYDELTKQSSSKNINGMPLKVSQTENLSDVGNVNIIYLSDGKTSMLEDILKTIQGKPVMIIAEREGLFKKGAGFSFVLMDNNTLRFDINNSDLEKRQIKVSKNITSLANSTL